MSAAHTPGPWREYSFGGRQIGGPEGDAVCSMWGSVGNPEDDANARLIVAAPDLLNALEGLVAIIQKAGLSQLARGVELGQTSWAVKASDRMEVAHWAIAKATTAVDPNSVGTPQGVNQK